MALSPASSRGGASVVLSASLTLTNAQIKALPTTARTIVASPGAGSMIVPILAYVLSDLTSVYTGIDAATEAPYIWIAPDASPLQIAPFVNDESPITTLTALMTGTNEFGALLFTVPTITAIAQTVTIAGSNGGPSDWANLPLKIGSTNSIDFTGGNAANSFVVTVLYTLLAV